MAEFLFAASRDVQRNEKVISDEFLRQMRFLFAVARGVQRNDTTRVFTDGNRCFYSLSRGAYSGTRRQPRRRHGPGRAVSIRCREGRTAERLSSGPPSCRAGSGFYSLSRGAYSGNHLQGDFRSPHVVSIRCREGRTAERGPTPSGSTWAVPTCFYSLSRGAYSGTGFGVSSHTSRGVSIRCREGRTAERTDSAAALNELMQEVSIRCREGRTAEPSRTGGHRPRRRVSIRCREGRTAEQFLPSEPRATQAAFLFAVARGVQRNEPIWYRASGFEGFYSLSRGAYSGTCPQGTNDVLAWETFLFAVARGVQRNSSGSSKELPWIVSIRCREGRTAEPYPLRRGRDQHKRCPFSHPTLGGTFARSPNTPSRRICAGQRLAHPRHLPLLQPPTTCDPGYLALPNRECG